MSTEDFFMPTQKEIVQVLRDHHLIRLREKVTRAFLIGSFASGRQNSESDVDILLEVKPKKGYSDTELTDIYRNALRQYFVTHNIREKMDSVHPQWCGRRVDLYLTYDADVETRPKLELAAFP